WARSATWKRAENATRTMLTLGQSDQVDKILVRHLSVGAFIELVREDHHLISPQGEERLLGQPITTRYLRMNSFQFGYQSEIVQWWTTKHSPETERLLSDVLWPSTLTCLLHPQLAPPGWTPLQVAPVLHQRDFARAVCYVDRKSVV